METHASCSCIKRPGSSTVAACRGYGYKYRHGGGTRCGCREGSTSGRQYHMQLQSTAMATVAADAAQRMGVGLGTCDEGGMGHGTRVGHGAGMDWKRGGEGGLRGAGGSGPRGNVCPARARRMPGALPLY